MTLKELHRKLKKLGVSTNEYYLHGLYGSPSDNDKPALTIRKGKYTYEYEVYYKERGLKHSSNSFTSEMSLLMDVLDMNVLEGGLFDILVKIVHMFIPVIVLCNTLFSQT